MTSDMCAALISVTAPGVGRKYEVVNVTRSLARNKLLLSGAAIYASPQNLEANKLHAEVSHLLHHVCKRCSDYLELSCIYSWKMFPVLLLEICMYIRLHCENKMLSKQNIYKNKIIIFVK